MYNEVFKRCPKEDCNGLGYMQIHQIVLGFGGFYLDSPESIARELDKEQVIELKEAVERTGWFTCDECKETFNINEDEKTDEDKIDIINSIGKRDEQED